jgi:hypothetical protein
MKQQDAIPSRFSGNIHNFISYHVDTYTCRFRVGPAVLNLFSPAYPHQYHNEYWVPIPRLMCAITTEFYKHSVPFEKIQYFFVLHWLAVKFQNLPLSAMIHFFPRFKIAAVFYCRQSV